MRAYYNYLSLWVLTINEITARPIIVPRQIVEPIMFALLKSKDKKMQINETIAIIFV